MNSVLDYDTLEMIGAALRDARAQDVEAPLPEKLLVLCEKLGEETARNPPAVDAGRTDAQS